MKTNTLKLKKEMLTFTTTSNHEQSNNKYRVQVKLENNDEQSIIHYHKTISAMANYIRSCGWHVDVCFTETTDVNFTLNRNQNL